ncbi:4-hydroxy-3-methylbut-2-enyl diphosphate reductase [Nanoarchaeota archaeon]
MVDKILLAKPRGFCAGVERAIGIVEKALKDYGPPIYVRHKIVHNDYVVDSLKAKGAVFVEELSEVPDGSNVIFSAHGSAPNVRTEAKNLGLNFFDAVCPLVAKVHSEAASYAEKRYSIIYIGHKKHQEAKGTTGQVNPHQVHVVETVQDVENIHVVDPQRVAYLTQTTLSVYDTAEIIAALQAKFPEIKSPLKQDICYATTNRQEAIQTLARQCQLVLVIGDEQSSNSKRLRETAERYCKSFLISDREKIDEKWFENVTAVGITSGASVPEELVRGVVDLILSKNRNASVEDVTFQDEKIFFPIPEEIKFI